MACEYDESQWPSSGWRPNLRQMMKFWLENRVDKCNQYSPMMTTETQKIWPMEAHIDNIRRRSSGGQMKWGQQRRDQYEEMTEVMTLPVADVKPGIVTEVT